MNSELDKIKKLYENYNKVFPKKKNLLHNSVDIFYLDGYNIKKEFSFDFVISVEGYGRDIALSSISRGVWQEDRMIKKFILSDYGKTWRFSMKEAKVFRNNLFKKEEC